MWGFPISDWGSRPQSFPAARPRGSSWPRSFPEEATGKTIYVLDEPTTGLHFADVHKLVEILRRLSEGGNTVVVIEHNLDVIKTADYIIDMGPEGGDRGGTVIAKGTPEQVAESPVSYTGRYVKKYLESAGRKSDTMEKEIHRIMAHSDRCIFMRPNRRLNRPEGYKNKEEQICY